MENFYNSTSPRGRTSRTSSGGATEATVSYVTRNSFEMKDEGSFRRTRSFDAQLFLEDRHEEQHEVHFNINSTSPIMNKSPQDITNTGKMPRKFSNTKDSLTLDITQIEPTYLHSKSQSSSFSKHRRVRSFDTGLHLMDQQQIPQRSRAYTKSLGNLVKHLAPSSTDSRQTLIGASPASRSLVSPGFTSPLGRMMGSWPKIWSPRSESAVSSTPVEDYPIKYEFALVLHNKPTTPRILARNGLDEMGKAQLGIIRRCINAGLEVSVLSSTLYSRKYICLLLRPSASRLHIEKNRLVLERWLQIGAIGEVPSEIEQLIASSDIGSTGGSKSPQHMMNTSTQTTTHDNHDNMMEKIEYEKFTPAERIQTIARIITSTSNLDELNPPGAKIEIDDENRNDPIIASCFPLHNRRVNNLLYAKSTQWWWKSNEITNELRYHYGERVAFYFSFVFLYTKCLFGPAIVGTLLYLSFRWVSSIQYMRGLCIFGFCMCTIWGTGLIKVWSRKNNLLNDAWNLRLFKEADYPNTQFKPQGYHDVVDSHGVLLFREPYYNPIYRIPAYLQTFIVFSIFIFVYIVGITFFVQWYTAAMMAPLCSKCPQCDSFLTCFKSERPIIFSDRWFYILVQGIFLGISLDIFVYLLSVKLLKIFVVKENHQTEAQFNRTMINRLFVINWISFFLWFILIAFVIIPFGKEVEQWLAENLKIKKLTVDWENGIIDMSTALVTPLLITQALNLLIDTALPYAVRRESIRASKLAHKMRANPAETLLALSEYQSSLETSSTQTSLDFRSKIELQMMTPIRIPYIEKELGVNIQTLEGFENEKYFMTADDVLEESRLPLYNAFPDYLRMVIQFGYVVMFSVVWPFCAIAAFLNNIVHVRNSFHKLLVHRRRPVPRKTNSIGQWEKMLFITLVLGIFMVVGLICLSSGELEYFVKECLVLERFNGTNFSMNPDFSCLDISSRFLVALVLEHTAILIVFMVMDNISDTPASVRTSFQRKKELIRRAICGHGKTAASSSSSSSMPPHPNGNNSTKHASNSTTTSTNTAPHHHHFPHKESDFDTSGSNTAQSSLSSSYYLDRTSVEHL